MSVAYDSDVVAWADEQVALLRACKLAILSISPTRWKTLGRAPGASC